MFSIKAPERYINEAKSIQLVGQYISNISKKAIVIGGRKALESTGNDLFTSLDNAGITYQTEIFTGYCTKQAIGNYIEITQQSQVGVVVGVGGGKVLDLVKAVADKLTLPVVTIPTIAATCAAWSALTVLYDDTGKVNGYLALQTSPKLVLVDPQILVKAPERYLQAGIADTIVKWYEFVPYANEAEYQIALQISLNTAKHALKILHDHSLQAIENNKEGRVTKEFKEVVDAIIALAGLVGSISDEKPRVALAHSIHDSMTAIPETHASLHGEKVIFGLIAQFVLEGKSKSEIIQHIEELNRLNLPVSFKQLGLNGNAKTINEIAEGVKFKASLSFEATPELIEKALKQANDLGEKSLGVRT